MIDNELNYYEKFGDWDFSHIKYHTERETDWGFYDQIRENTNTNSLCLDIGTGGGEMALSNYPEVGMLIATDFSEEMLKTANENLQKHLKENPNKRVKFAQMDNLNMTFPNNLFDLVSARHTVINAKQIYNTLRPGGVLIIEGVDKEDCWELKKLFGRGQCYNDEIAISDQDYQDIKDVGFTEIEKIEIYEYEYYETEDDLMALLLKAPILDDFSEMGNDNFVHREIVEKDLFDAYVKQYKTEKGILLKRKLYGIVAKK